MPAPTKAWVNIADSAVDPDSPLDTALMTALRDNHIHLRDWLGASYAAGAAQNHNHDGVNSAAIETGVMVRNGGFEDGTNGWTLTPFTGGSFAINTSNEQEGASCLGVTSTVLANGGGEVLSAGFTPIANALRPLAFTLAVKASVANISSKAEVVWYDDAQAQISVSTIYSNTNTPTTAALREITLTPPSTAKYFKIKLTGGIPASGSATGTVYFDTVSAAFAATYSGSLVETGALVLGGPLSQSADGTIDLGSNRVMAGVRVTASTETVTCGVPSGSPTYMYLRGYNIKNN